jgi:F0F1-type ATP synthase assembly protein I
MSLILELVPLVGIELAKTVSALTGGTELELPNCVTANKVMPEAPLEKVRAFAFPVREVKLADRNLI